MSITFNPNGKITGNRLSMPAGSGSPLSVIEEFEVPCDGTSITTAKGTVSIANQFAAQPLTTTFADLNGSTFSYGHSSSDVTSSNIKGAYMSITGAVELNGSTDYVELRLRLNMVSQTPTVYDSYFGGYKIIGA